MKVAEAKELLLRMEDQIRHQIEAACQYSSKASEPECEIHSSEASSIASSHKQIELQEHLDEICSLRDLFVMQSQALSMIQEAEKQERPCSPIPLVVASIPDPDDFSASSILLLETSELVALKEKKSCEETVEETTKSQEDGMVETLQEISPTCVSKLYSNTLVGNDDSAKIQDIDGALSDTDSLYPDFDGSDSEIQAAINEIRREASQMDAIMALDQLKTLESELEVTTKALQERSTEVEDLKIQVEELEERVGSLELERDLFKADASKLKEDLKTCVERMFDISNVAGDSSIMDGLDLQNDKEKDTKDQASTSQISNVAVTGKPRTTLSVNELLPSPPKTVIDHTYPLIQSSNRGGGDHEKTRLCRVPKESREVIRRTPTFSDPSFDRAKLLDLPRAVTMHPKATTNAKTVNAQRDAIFRRTESFRHRRSISSQSSLFGNSTSPRMGRPSQKQRSSSFSVEMGRDDSVSQIDGKDNNRRCGLFRRSSSRRRNASSRDDIEIMREQISQLHKMMKTSLSTSEKLRKRLAMISRYYEGIIRKLQEQVVETKTEKRTMQVQLANQMAQLDHENRVTIMQLEMKLQRKEDEIKMLRQQLEI